MRLNFGDTTNDNLFKGKFVDSLESRQFNHTLAVLLEKYLKENYTKNLT